MNPSLFLKNKVQKEISHRGSTYLFKRYSKDDYGQTLDEIISVSIQCIFHQSSGFKALTVADSTKVETKPQPMIMCLKEDADKLAKEDVVEINGNKYAIVGFNDIQNYGVVNDISLEIVIL